MGGSKMRSWTLGTAVLALLILVGAWFLVVSPQLTAAAETRASVDDELARQDVLRARLATLKEQAAHLEDYKAELDELEEQIPTTAELAAYVRAVQTVAEAQGVTIIGVTPGVPTAVVPPVIVEPEPTTDITEAPAEEATPTEQPAAPAGPTLVAVPVSFTLVGTYAGTTGFLDALQNDVPRLLLVTSFTAVTQNVAEPSGGRPATVPGDVELSIDGMIYVLVPAAEAGDTADDVDSADADVLVPLPSTERNPFTPVAGN